jgi:ion channel-forming bestrophin family protein
MTNFNSKNINWFSRAFNIKHSVIPKIWLRLLVVTLFAVFITFLYYQKYPVSLPVLASIVPNIILGLLLVFRTNTAYDRFWEGRKLWGSLINNTRSIARVVSSNNLITLDNKRRILTHLVNFSERSKEIMFGDLNSSTLPDNQALMLNPNIYELQLLQVEIDSLVKEGKIDSIRCDNITSKIDNLNDVIGGCQRIINTPIPLAYSIHIKQLILLYCFSIPFQFVSQTGWWTPPLTLIICIALMGIEEIGLEIENPFGKDHNDLDLDKFVNSVKQSIEESLIS